MGLPVAPARLLVGDLEVLIDPSRPFLTPQIEYFGPSDPSFLEFSVIFKKIDKFYEN